MRKLEPFPLRLTWVAWALLAAACLLAPSMMCAQASGANVDECNSGTDSVGSSIYICLYGNASGLNADVSVSNGDDGYMQTIVGVGAEGQITDSLYNVYYDTGVNYSDTYVWGPQAYASGSVVPNLNDPYTLNGISYDCYDLNGLDDDGGNCSWGEAGQIAVSVEVTGPPTISLVPSNEPSSVYGQAVTFTATITNASGTVSFYDTYNGGTNTQIGSGSIDTYWNTATFTTTSTAGLPSTLQAGSHSITAYWGGNSSYGPVTSNAVTQTVAQATPEVSWTTPAAISYGTQLSSTQLDATANVAGAYVYTPALGAVLDPGSQALLVNFFPTDAVDYTPAGGSTILQVNSGTEAPIYSYTITPSNGPSGYAANGNLLSYTDSVNGAWSNLSYDALNRLSAGAQAPVSGTAQNFCWSYDSFGNRTAQVEQSTSCSAPTAAVSYNANNQVTWVQNTSPSGFIYDAAGNVQQDNINNYLYDAEGRICAVQNRTVGSMTGYVYDAEGNRVAKGTLTSWSCNTGSNGFTATNTYVLGPAGEQMTEETVSGGATTWLHTNVYAAGQLIATYEAGTNNPLYFQLSDWLGTRRVETDYAGNTQETCTNLPFGDGGTACLSPTEQFFTGKERDTESGNDYFGARYYGSSMGRFMSPDDGTDQHPDNPQSWNLYTYGRNNPLVFTDPTGHSTQTAANGDVLAVYDDNDLGVYRHGDIDNRKDWDGSKLDDTDPETKKMGATERWGEFANWDDNHPYGISGTAAPGAFIHFGQSIDSTISDLNAQSNKQGLSSTAIDSMHGGPLDIKTGKMADHGVYTGYLLNGKYASIRSAGNFLAGLNVMTGTFAGSHISPQFAQKLFGAYQAGGKAGLAYTLSTGRQYPGTSAPYWGEQPYSGYMQQEGIGAGSHK